MAQRGSVVRGAAIARLYQATSEDQHERPRPRDRRTLVGEAGGNAGVDQPPGSGLLERVAPAPILVAAHLPQPRIENVPAARAEVQRILDAEARRVLAARLEGEAIVAATRSDKDALEDGLDDPATTFEAQAVPISGSVEIALC